MRVLSYNIRGGLGMDTVRDTGRIAGVVRPLNADVICFQEVHQRLPWSAWVDQPRLLKNALGGQFTFQKNINTGIGGYGLGVWTRLPVVHVRRHFLPQGRERRGALEVAVRNGERTVTLFCTHFGLTWDERTAQAARLSQLVRSVNGPVLVCGDFNDVATAPYLQSFLGDTGLVDCGAGEELPTYPADVPEVRIDFLLASPELAAGQVCVVPTLASDHLPLYVDTAYGFSPAHVR